MIDSLPGLNTSRWRKSSYSNGDGGDCVEVVLPAHGGLVTVRDTKAGPGGHVLTFPASQWERFVARARSSAGHGDVLREIEPFSD
ncbi:DUF397 domain-containing protein [Streptomyces sp. AA1529]|uniref:DUF397 domain-containing protein n=1 Tax=Streptomyces sp. AA1529 TaxID=1203257 RepID=UPI003D714546